MCVGERLVRCKKKGCISVEKGFVGNKGYVCVCISGNLCVYNLYICVCIYMCIHVCIYMCACVMFVCKFVCVYVCICVCDCVCLREPGQ